EDVQLNFGVTVNESMGDAVKITVIATGFRPDSVSPDRREVPEIKIQARPPEPAPAFPPAAPVAATPFFEPEPVMELAPEPEPEPEEPAPVEAEPVLDMDDLDTPAYLRQGRLLN